jgi:hypothetical protein
MVDRSFGGRSIPGVQISVGRSNQDLLAIKRSMDGVVQELRAMSQAAKDASAAVNSIKPPRVSGGSSSGGTRQPREKSVADLDRELAQVQSRSATASRRLSATQDRANYAQMRTNQRMKDRSLNAKMNELKEQERSSMLYRAVNAFGWMPGVPSSVYMAQMALGEMGAGLPLGAVALGMGGLGLGMAGLGLNAALTNQARTGEQVASQVGTVPGFETGGAVSQHLAQLGGTYHLSGSQPQDIAAGLAAGGLSRDQAMGNTDQAFAQTAVLVNTFGMSVKDAADLVSKQYTELGRSSADVTAMLQNLAQVALGTGLPASGIAAVLAGSDLAATVGSKDAGAAAAIYRGVYGDNATATSMAQIATQHGTGAYAVAGMLGMDVTQLDRLRGTKTGQGQIVDQLDALARASVAANGPEAGFSAFNARLTGAGGQALSWDAFQRVLQAAPNAGVLAAAQPPIAGPPTPGSAQNGLANVAAGNLAAGSAASQPWNVKDMTVNAAQVTLAAVGNTVQNTEANHAAAVAIAQHTAGTPNPQVALPWWLEAIKTVEQQLGVGGTSGAASGGTVQHEHTVNVNVAVKQNGQTIGTTKVTAPLPNSGQSYGQYTPQRPGSR